MAFDGILIHHLCSDIREKIVGGRIDKIHQPESDELSILIRGYSENFQLFISIESAMPYFTLTQNKKENPQTPPMFCMLMRKHLSGGRILDFGQIGHERVIYLDIESKNELGDLEVKRLYVEIMGKHSNIILTKSDGTIIDCIKRITPDMSRIRTVLPGLEYHLIPSHQKNLFDALEAIIENLKKASLETPKLPLFKALYQNIQGFSPFLSKWLLNQNEFDPDLTCGQMTEPAFISLEKALTSFSKQMKASDYKGYIYKDENDLPKMVYFEPAYPSLYTFETYDHLYDAVDHYYAKSNKVLKIHQRIQNVKKTVAQRIERSTNKLAKLKNELETAENSDIYQVKGELLLANLYQLSRGMNKVSLPNYYDNNAPLEIALDVRLEPSENAQRYFKKYNKLKHARKELVVQIEETEDEITYLENCLLHMEQIDSQSEINDIITELSEQGIIKAKYRQKNKAKNNKHVFRTFVSSDGFTIHVGKNNVQNDYLTLKYASNKDIWLHTKIIPGSHVIIRTEGKAVPEQTILEAATLAAYHSKARASSNVPVDYTEVKYVVKPNGAKPGMVIYTHNKTMYVTPEESMVEALRV